MSLLSFLYRKFDPSHLLSSVTWILIVALAILSSLSLSAMLLLLVLKDAAAYRYHFSYNILIPLSGLSCLVCLLLLHSRIGLMRQRVNDHNAYLLLHEEQKKAADFVTNLMNVAPIGVHSIDRRGIVIEMNQTELDWLGYTREEILDKKHITELWDETERPRFGDILKDGIRQGYLKNVEINYRSKDGQVIPMLLNSKMIHDQAGNFSHGISTIYNFTEGKKLEDALVAARQEADNANHLKRLFMANMSHEIRTPLNVILGFSNLLVRANLPPNLQEYVQSIQTSGNNLLAIVNDILDFEKVQSGLLRIESIEFNLPSLLRAAFTMIHPAAAEKGLAEHLDIAPDIPAVLCGDPMRLTQILFNLLGNAVKFTHRGSITLRARTIPPHSHADPVRIRIDIEDTGIGIPPSEHARIFERFTQATPDTTRKYGGTGLGLAIVKLMVELQRGALFLDSEEGRGSTFTVEIPYLLIRKNMLPASPVPIEQGAHLNFTGRRVLVVEDNPMNRRIAEINLLEIGLTVTQAANGREAVEILRVDPTAFDLVFLDIQMPEMDGYMATQLIRSELGLTELPIIAVTAHVLEGEREKALACGMNDYLTKPVRRQEVIMVLLRYLSGFWDAQVLRAYGHGKTENFREIAELFIRQFPQELAGLHQALQTGDFPAATAAAHNLRSTVGYAGFHVSFDATLSWIETAASSENPDQALLLESYDKLAHDGRYALAIIKREILDSQSA